MKPSRLAPRLGRRTLVSMLAATACLPAARGLAETKGSLPKGFSKFKGPSDDFFESTVDGQRVISIRSQVSGGIVRCPVDFTVEPGLRLQWDWRVNTLPSSVAENTAATHDYTSIAVEFDDGRDLTWLWSAALKVGEHFRCPLPNWPTETHYVVESGSGRLGEWISEERDVFVDAMAALQNVPAKVVAVWLIHYTVPQKLSASTDFRRISLVSARGSGQVVFPV